MTNDDAEQKTGQQRTWHWVPDTNTACCCTDGQHAFTYFAGPFTLNELERDLAEAKHATNEALLMVGSLEETCRVAALDVAKARQELELADAINGSEFKERVAQIQVERQLEAVEAEAGRWKALVEAAKELVACEWAISCQRLRDEFEREHPDCAACIWLARVDAEVKEVSDASQN